MFARLDDEVTIENHFTDKQYMYPSSVFIAPMFIIRLQFPRILLL